MKRYRVSFVRWAEYEEFVMAASEDEAEELAREQLDNRDGAEPVDSGTNLVGAEEDDE